ncbi:MAG: hypothetical protein Q4G59_05300, partial [Planctomycetia bacterium]|nr:hypothetical protein [Planctomycetia bacterium]
MNSSEEKLCSLLSVADCDGVVAFFHGMSEKDRRALAPAVTEWLKQNRKIISKCTAQKKNPGNGCATKFPYVFSYLATASVSELKSPAGRSMLNLL